MKKLPVHNGFEMIQLSALFNHCFPKTNSKVEIKQLSNGTTDLRVVTI